MRKSESILIRLLEGERISRVERNRAGKAFAAAGLDGNGSFDSKSLGIQAVNRALDSAGVNLSLDAVPADVLLGDEGTRVLPLYRTAEGGAVVEAPTGLSFSWYRRGSRVAGEPKSYEILAYLA